MFFNILRKYSKDIDSAGSALWFLMDFAWMMEQNEIAVALLFCSLIPLSIGGVFFNTRKGSHLLSDLATFCWFLMNSCWMLSDILETQWGINIAFMFFFIGVMFIVFSFVVSKINRENVEFRRLKND